MKVLIRERLVTLEEAALKLHITDGGTNSGPWVDKFLREVGLNPGYAWCDADQSYFEHEAGDGRLPIESASVLQTWETATRLGWVTTNPAPADLVLYRWTGSGAPFGDHIGLVVKVSSFGAFWKLQTIEGNTSSDDAGSQGNGDGMYARTRVVSKGMCGFVRIPGYVDLRPVGELARPRSVGGLGLPGKKILNEKPAPELVSENGGVKEAIAKPTLTKGGSTASKKKSSAKSSAKSAAKSGAKKTGAPKAAAKKTAPRRPKK